MQISFNSDYYFFVQKDIINFLEQSLSDNLKPHIERFFYPIHLLNVNRVLSTKYEHDDYIPLMSELLQEMLGSSVLKSFGGRKPYSYILDYLKDNGIIEQDTNIKFIIGKRAKAYRITEQYRYCQIRQVDVVNDYMHGKLVKWKEGLYDLSIPYLSANRMNLNSLSIDIEAATKYLEFKYQISLDDYLAGKLTNQVRIDKELASRYGKFEKQYAAINKIYFQPDFSRSKANNRVHTSLTSLSKNLRKFLYLPGEKARLFNIDCKNSQPLIFNVVIKEFADKQGIDIDKDLLLYKNLTESGKFYEFMAAKVGVDISTDEARDAFKKKCFSTIFYNEHYSKAGGKTEMIFQKLFPTVYEVLKYHKTSGKNRKDGPRRLALAMQRAEAKIFIDVVGKLLLDHNKSMFFTTIHDSVICLEHHIEIVKDAIKKAFSEYDIVPSLDEKVISENINPVIEETTNSQPVELIESINETCTQEVEEVPVKVIEQPVISDHKEEEKTVKETTVEGDSIITVQQKKEYERQIEKYGYILFWVQNQLWFYKHLKDMDIMRRMYSSKDELFTGEEKKALREILLKAKLRYEKNKNVAA